MTIKSLSNLKILRLTLKTYQLVARKFNQEYNSNEHKYTSIVEDYVKITSTYSYQTEDFDNLYNRDNIKNMNDYFTGIKVMVGASTALTVVA